MTEWTDDAAAFYERSIGQINNGFEQSGLRPSALYLSTTIRTDTSAGIDPMVDRGGWVGVDYGEGGNAVAMTVRAQCRDADSSTACWDDPSLSYDSRAAQLRANCECAAEQHYQYRWDELNRLAEARRYDRAGSGDWALAVRQRYRYDAANQRLVKQTLSEETSGPPEAVSLYVFPGDYERRGVTADQVDLEYDPSTTLGTESQYLIAGARVVFKPGGSIDALDREMRITQPLTDLIGSTSAVLDLDSGELIEAQTFYPNGAVESQQTTERVSLQLEPRGFTGKETDDEVGVVYFGERYLFQHLGRWASPDPLHVHSAGGGEALNSYHYISGTLLQARDPLGLECGDNMSCIDSDGNQIRWSHEDNPGNPEPTVYRMRLRIDVPGSDDAKRPSDHERGVEPEKMDVDPGHVWVVFEGPEDTEEARGWYPQSPPHSSGEVRAGVAGETRDDSERHYDYEATFEVSEEEFKAAKKYAEDQEDRQWSADYSCTDFALECLQAAGVEDLPDGRETLELPYRQGELEMGYPGVLAEELHEAEVGDYAQPDSEAADSDDGKVKLDGCNSDGCS